MRVMHRACDIQHLVRVLVVPAKSLSAGNQFGFGAFVIKRGKPEIWLAGQKPERSVTNQEHAEMIVATFAHELAHYEQWRDGLPLQERGVAIRAKRIIKALLRSGGVL